MKYLAFFVWFVLIANGTYAQEEPALRDQIKNQRFEFLAESASPLRGRMIFLTPGYNLKVSKDSVVSNLPYYGRAYQANLDPSKAGITFTSTDFEYSKKDRKKGGWELTIKAKDQQNSPQIFITVSPNGSASVRVNATDRQSISYNGRVKKP